MKTSKAGMHHRVVAVMHFVCAVSAAIVIDVRTFPRSSNSGRLQHTLSCEPLLHTYLLTPTEHAKQDTVSAASHAGTMRGQMIMPEGIQSACSAPFHKYQQHPSRRTVLSYHRTMMMGCLSDSSASRCLLSSSCSIQRSEIQPVEP